MLVVYWLCCNLQNVGKVSVGLPAENSDTLIRFAKSLENGMLSTSEGGLHRSVGLAMPIHQLPGLAGGCVSQNHNTILTITSSVSLVLTWVLVQPGCARPYAAPHGPSKFADHQG